MILFLPQTAIDNSIRPFNSSFNGEQNSINNENMLKPGCYEDSKDDSNMLEASQQTIDLDNLPLRQLNNKDNNISGIRRQASISSRKGYCREKLSSSSRKHRELDSRELSLCLPNQILNILIVDDSDLSRKMLSRLLRTSGYAFDEAEDGLIALNKVKEKMSVTTNGSEKNSFDVILMDFVMPNMDGPTATKAIRDLGYTAPIFGKQYIYMYACVSLS
jgi:CheY-like chemotaxis protein